MVNVTAQWLMGFVHYPSESKLLILSVDPFAKCKWCERKWFFLLYFVTFFFFSLSPGNFCPEMRTGNILGAHRVFLNCSFSSVITVVEDLHLHLVKKSKSLNILLRSIVKWRPQIFPSAIFCWLKENSIKGGCCKYNTYKAEGTIRDSG